MRIRATVELLAHAEQEINFLVDNAINAQVFFMPRFGCPDIAIGHIYHVERVDGKLVYEAELEGSINQNRLLGAYLFPMNCDQFLRPRLIFALDFSPPSLDFMPVETISEL